MPDREPRQQWSERHRTHVYWVEKAVAGFVLVASVFAVPRYTGLAQYFFVALGGAAMFKMFPSVRPLASWLVQRLPFLQSRPGPPPSTDTQNLPPIDRDE
jgi:hypothetical protein